ncbi:MAG: ABC transporter permease subunit [Spongiibacteraceae bacterium]|nr:ABC transporter permease subunit [Spongiibacteraceae bacterium]
MERAHAPSPLPQIDSRARLRRFKDLAAGWMVSAGGMSVLVAILLIFFYLLYEVLPMFQGASVDPVTRYPAAAAVADEGAAAPLLLAIEEQAEIAVRLDESGRAAFFSVQNGTPLRQEQLPLPAGTKITSFAIDTDASRLFAAGLSNGQLVLARHDYEISYDAAGVRSMAPALVYPYGDTPLELGDSAIQTVAVRDASKGLMVAAAIDGRLEARQWSKTRNFLTQETQLKEQPLQLPAVDIAPDYLLISPDQRLLYVIARSGDYRVLDVRNETLLDGGRLLRSGKVTEVKFLLGGVSLMVADSNGRIAQWSVVRRGGESELTEIRSLTLGNGAVRHVIPEHRRKGLIAVDGSGQLRLLHTTAERELLRQPLEGAPVALAIAPRANFLLVENAAREMQLWSVSNPHPEVSWSALWNKVWYENYREPAYVWQSSSASESFEPKYSLTPLAFGTLKAAFYAMLLGAPLAICGAIFTAYFMAPQLRSKVKPLIEMMEALPTVILGFLAGLWLAPFVERHLPGMFALLLFMPVGVLLAAFAWRQLPLGLRRLVPDGWEPVLLIPAVILVSWGTIELSGPLERTFFAGDMRSWLTNDLGITFDQRNALVVGIAMGFAVVPNIFSIAEDAIYSVPKHLSYGSLALGATPWQTLVGVVLPTASPGIFSALMIGMGRAVGETMIVLMATGNTPVMEANIFEGMRTLAANLAVEIGETEVDSTHYRVLFLAAFVLFGFTFIVNTIAEVVRQRLRRRYSVI